MRKFEQEILDTRVHIDQEKYAILNLNNDNYLKIYTELGSCCSLVGINKIKNIVFITHNRSAELVEAHIKDLEENLKKKGLSFKDFSLELFGGNSIPGFSEKSTEIGKRNRDKVISILEQIGIDKIKKHPRNLKGFSVLHINPESLIAKEEQKESTLIKKLGA